MVDLFITPSIIQAYVLKPEWGVRAYYNTITGNREPLNYFMRRGIYLHNKLGYNNRLRFYRTLVVEYNDSLKTLLIEGTPDHLNPLKELKTCNGNRTNDNHFKKAVEAASLQLQGYMLLTNTDYGYVVFVDRNTHEEILELAVPRDDQKFIRTVFEFHDYLAKIPRLDEFLKELKEDSK